MSRTRHSPRYKCSCCGDSRVFRVIARAPSGDLGEYDFDHGLTWEFYQDCTDTCCQCFGEHDEKPAALPLKVSLSELVAA